MRLAWFSPVPPVRSGIAACSADLVAALGAEHDIDVFVDEPVARLAAGVSDPRDPRADGPRPRSAHDFVWLHRQRPYDLTIYQLGNSSHHDYEWPYLFRYPGLTVLHDVHLHHARAAALLRTRRADDYRVEFRANHPDAHPDAAELAVAGFDSFLYYLWPMTRLVAAASRVTAVHSAAIADQLQAENPDAAVDTIHLGHGTTVAAERATRARRRVRARYGILDDAVLFGSFGGLAPDKRIPQILDALAAVLPYAPSARLLLAGTAPEHYDLRADVAARQLTDRVHLTGYLDSDDELTDCIAAVDVALTLRWPTARETSGPWLRCLAAGRATVISDLVQTACVPALDPRTWTVAATGEREPEPICVAVDILDEDHSLRLAMRRLAADPGLRGRLGEAAQAYWRREHSVERMVDDYRRVIGRAVDRPAPAATLPAHATDTGERLLRTLVAPFGLPSPLE